MGRVDSEECNPGCQLRPGRRLPILHHPSCWSEPHGPPGCMWQVRGASVRLRVDAYVFIVSIKGRARDAGVLA